MKKYDRISKELVERGIVKLITSRSKDFVYGLILLKAHHRVSRSTSSFVAVTFEHGKPVLFYNPDFEIESASHLGLFL